MAQTIPMATAKNRRSPDFAVVSGRIVAERASRATTTRDALRRRLITLTVVALLGFAVFAVVVQLDPNSQNGPLDVIGCIAFAIWCIALVMFVVAIIISVKIRNRPWTEWAATYCE